MTPVEKLMHEHRTIEAVLRAFESYVGDAVTDGKGGPEELARFVDFIQGYADRYHHGKEEDLLFTQMAESGFPTASGPLAVMYHEHEQGRALVRELKALAERAEPWRSSDRATVAKKGTEYIALLRQHIHKEDDILYPMALARMSAPAAAALEGAFGDFEARAENRAERERLEVLARALVDACGDPGLFPPPAEADPDPEEVATAATKRGAPAGEAFRLERLVDYGAGAVVSRTLTKGPGGTLTVFAFDQGQELSEHSAPFDAYVTILDGDALLTVGGRQVPATAGETVLMPANVPHAVHAPTQFKMLLTMIKHSQRPGT